MKLLSLIFNFLLFMGCTYAQEAPIYGYTASLTYAVSPISIGLKNYGKKIDIACGTSDFSMIALGKYSMSTRINNKIISLTISGGADIIIFSLATSCSFH